jgi:phosphatidate cytidylyltransferase
VKNYIARIITGFLLVLAICLAVISGPDSLFLLVLLITTGCLIEFLYLFDTHKRNTIILLISSAIHIQIGLFIYLHVLYGLNYEYLLIIIPQLILIFCFFTFSRYMGLDDVNRSVFGLVYSTLAFLGLFLMSFHDGDYTHEIILGFFIIHWAFDTCAFLTGSLIGKHVCFPRISPQKTTEGYIGGALCTIGGAVLYAYLSQSLTFIHWIAIAIIIIIFGSLGDLFESRLKRNLDKKDSGKLLPGHGGLLDRFDGILFSSPVMLAYINLIIF